MIIDFENINFTFGEDFILENLNLKIKKGENWAILGQNGCGKSTLIKLFASQLHPLQKFPHKKKIFGKERYSIEEIKKHLGIITNDLHNYFEKFGAYLNVYEVVLSGYYSSIGVFKHQDFSQEQHQRAREVLEFLNLYPLKDKKVFQLSTGQLRKTIIARALIHKPKVFILDEPTVGLDIKAQITFIETMRELSKYSNIILVTHHIEEIFEEISHVALMYNKTIFIQGKKEEILTSQNLSKIFEINLKINKKNSRYFFEKVG